MKHKGVIVDIIPWAKVGDLKLVVSCLPVISESVGVGASRFVADIQSRTFFYGRLRRKLALLSVQTHVRQVNPSLTAGQV